MTGQDGKKLLAASGSQAASENEQNMSLAIPVFFENPGWTCQPTKRHPWLGPYREV
jgi:hypothetical protein